MFVWCAQFEIHRLIQQNCISASIGKQTIDRIINTSPFLSLFLSSFLHLPTFCFEFSFVFISFEIAIGETHLYLELGCSCRFNWNTFCSCSMLWFRSFFFFLNIYSTAPHRTSAIAVNTVARAEHIEMVAEATCWTAQFLSVTSLYIAICLQTWSEWILLFSLIAWSSFGLL